MLEILKQFNIDPALAINIITTISLIDFLTLGIVFIFGRMLGVCKSHKCKNIIAIVSIICMSFIYLFYYKGLALTSLSFYIQLFIYSLSCITCYVLFFWRLYGRIDSILDKKISKDNEKDYTE